MPSQQRKTRRARPTQRRLYTVTTTSRGSTVLPGVTEWWRLYRQKVVAVGLALLVIGTLFEFFSGDAFYVYSCEVTGLQFMSKAEIERASGIIGYNVFFIDARAVERTLAKLPEVKSVHVSTGLFNRVGIEIDERTPDIAWLRGVETYWVDGDGIVFKARANLTQLPAIRDLDQTMVKPGQTALPAAIDAYRAVRALWPAAPRAFEWSAARGLGYTDEHGWKIYLGDANQMAGKLVTLHTLVPQLISQNAGIKFIDLSKGDPFYQ
jgi:cell division septal protein FtsQ